MESMTVTLVGNSSTISVDFFPPIDLSNSEYILGLINFETYHSIPNIDETNNKFYYKDKNSKTQKFQKITIPVGSYKIKNMGNVLKKELCDPSYISDNTFFTNKI